MAKPSIGTTETAMCSKCGENPKAQSHEWCTGCKAELQKRYDHDRHEMFERKGFTGGVKAMRELLAGEFAKHGPGYFRGDECAALIRQAKGPEFASDNQTP